MSYSEIVSYLWGVSDLLRGPSQRGKYRNFIEFEIKGSRYFSRYTPARPLEEIEADIRAIEQDILRMLAEVTGGPAAEVNVGTPLQVPRFSAEGNKD